MILEHCLSQEGLDWPSHVALQRLRVALLKVNRPVPCVVLSQLEAILIQLGQESASLPATVSQLAQFSDEMVLDCGTLLPETPLILKHVDLCDRSYATPIFFQTTAAEINRRLTSIGDLKTRPELTHALSILVLILHSSPLMQTHFSFLKDSILNLRNTLAHNGTGTLEDDTLKK